MAYPGDNEGWMQPLPETGMTFEVPVTDLINKGKMKRISGRIFEALEDVEVQVYGRHVYTLKAGRQYYAINADLNQPHLIIRPAFTF
jgi:hypothetical protein